MELFSAETLTKILVIIFVCVCLYLLIMLADLSEGAQNTTLYAIIGLAVILLIVFVILPSLSNY